MGIEKGGKCLIHWVEEVTIQRCDVINIVVCKSAAMNDKSVGEGRGG